MGAHFPQSLARSWYENQGLKLCVCAWGTMGGGCARVPVNRVWYVAVVTMRGVWGSGDNEGGIPRDGGLAWLWEAGGTQKDLSTSSF
jgi:hypothetical protein